MLMAPAGGVAQACHSADAAARGSQPPPNWRSRCIVRPTFVLTPEWGGHEARMQGRLLGIGGASAVIHR